MAQDWSKLDPRTPVIVGVGQAVERIDDPAWQGLNAADLAARAAHAALIDCGVPGAARELVTLVGAVRTFEDSNAAPSPFGKPDKCPLAVARRLGLAPVHAVLGKVGGQSPVTLLMDMAARIHAGKAEAALVFGAEAISNTRHLVAQGAARDWAETCEGEIEDEGLGVKGLLSPLAIAHGIVSPPIAYALMENARAHRLGRDPESYRAEMGRLFAPFSAVAAANPYSAAAQAPLSAEDIATPSPKNRLVSDPYTIKLVARDQVNQGAAALVMSLGAAIDAWIARDRIVFIHGAAHAAEKEPLARPVLDAYPAADAAIAEALRLSGRDIDAIGAFDFYSCFPIAVFNPIGALSIAPDDPRGLTVTGGLPFFGGAGNNYSMHAIAAMAERLREMGGHGLVGANGGFQSKYAALVLSPDPAPWQPIAHDAIQHALDAVADVAPMAAAAGTGTIETLTVWRNKGEPAEAIAIGRTDEGQRFIANAANPEVLARTAAGHGPGARVSLGHDGRRGRYAFVD